ncbi:DUF3150 domain-containing protein [Shinella sp. JR1-6]|uniref:DUF3150 domain-containing protein n=1 Tax=Shinella sp. JR1-6 TaxID=2527671 RepID=UPI0014049DD4|nr:DUF3150 domain-containing protein [Shinella sp. JR1-6]
MNMNIPTTALASNALASRAMVVSLSIAQWSGRRLDRDVTNEVNRSKSAASDAGRYNKAIVKPDALKPIAKLVGEIRNEFNGRTLPWMDDGKRIMAAQAFMAHAKWLADQRNKFEKEVERFLRDYPQHVQDAQRHLGTMFRQEDYPDADEITMKFSFITKVMPVPTAGDFRANLAAEQVHSIRQDIERDVQEAARAAVRNVYERIVGAVEHMHERMVNYKPATRPGETTAGVFRDSLVENIRDLVKVMPSLNITGDPELDALADRLARLSRHDAETLRNSDSARENIADEAQRILDDISAFMK